MNVIQKFAAYGAALTAALALALALTVSLPAERTEAAAGTAVLTLATMPADATNVLTITDADIGAVTDFAILNIDPSSAGSAKFTSGGGQSLVCFNGATCDTDGSGVNGTIIVSVTGTGAAGAVILKVELFDAVDGIDGAAPDGGTVTAAYTQTAAAASILLVSNATSTAATATGTSQIIFSAIVNTSTGAAVTAGTSVTFTSVGQGAFSDTVAGTGVLTSAAVPGGAVLFDDAVAAIGGSGCIAGEGLQQCVGTTGTADDGQDATEVANVASVAFEGASVSGKAAVTAKTGPAATPVTSNELSITLFGAASTLTNSASSSFIYRSGGATNVNAVVLDGSGNGVTGAVPAPTNLSPTIGGTLAAGTVAPDCGAGTSTTGKCSSLYTAPTGGTAGSVVTIQQSAGAAAALKDTAEITLVDVPATVAVTIQGNAQSAGDPTVGKLTTTQVDVTVMDVNVLNAPDGTNVALLVTGDGVVIPKGTLAAGGGVALKNGVASFDLVAANNDGVVELVALVTCTAAAGGGCPASTAIQQQQLTVIVGEGPGGTTPPPAGGSGTVTGFAPGPGQSGLVVFNDLSVVSDAFGLVCGDSDAGSTLQMTNATGVTDIYTSGAPDFANSLFTGNQTFGGTQAGSVVCA